MISQHPVIARIVKRGIAKTWTILNGVEMLVCCMPLLCRYTQCGTRRTTIKRRRKTFEGDDVKLRSERAGGKSPSCSAAASAAYRLADLDPAPGGFLPVVTLQVNAHVQPRFSFLMTINKHGAGRKQSSPVGLL